MSILVALLIGTGMGTAVGLWFQRNADYLLFDILSGVCGAILGLVLAFLTHPGQVFELFSWVGFMASLLGSAIAIALYQSILHIPKKKKGSVEKS